MRLRRHGLGRRAHVDGRNRCCSTRRKSLGHGVDDLRIQRMRFEALWPSAPADLRQVIDFQIGDFFAPAL